MPSNFPKILVEDQFDERNTDFRNSILGLSEEIISADNFHHLTRIYNSAKDLEIRKRILKLLYDFEFLGLKNFFDSTYKKERYLDMKIYALRGLSNFTTESDIAKLLAKFNLTLAKRQKTTPYNYQEYELLKGQNALPYLTKRFAYKCFFETLEQVNSQYNAMPEAFKGHFTTDDNGEIILLRKSEEVKNIMDKFWQDKRT